MWRIDRDESNFTPEEIIAWDWVLPHMHLLILDEEYDEVNKLIKRFKKYFSTDELKAAAQRIKDRPMRQARRELVFRKLKI